MKEDIRTVQDDIIKHTDKMDDYEMYSRRNSVRVYGIAEVPRNENEDCSSKILKIFKDEMNLVLDPNDISRSHRAGKPSDNITRAILVKFVRHDKKVDTIKARKALKGKPIVIKEDVTQPRAKIMHELYEYGKLKRINVWSTDGRIFAKVRGKIYPVRSRSDVNIVKHQIDRLV